MIPDVMQVCMNGHVITDLLRSNPGRGQSRCDRCGASTLSRCSTCGQELTGANFIPGMTLVGNRRPPSHCPSCGAAFPWANPEPIRESSNALEELNSLLRRLPRMIRQLRTRFADRPPFYARDAHDLEDLVRAVLPLCFDDVRPISRTPSYATDTRTDFLLMPDALAITSKWATATTDLEAIVSQVQEDVRFHTLETKAKALIVLVYDPDERLRHAEPPETISALLPVQWIIQ